MKKRDFVTLLVVILIFGIIALSVFIIKKYTSDVVEKSEYDTLTLLTDETMFLSVSNSINKINEYSTSNPALLNYIVNDSIDYLKYENTYFTAKEIYVISNLNLYKYYVMGEVYTNDVDGYDYIENGYYILNFDMSSESFSIDIIDSDTYNKASDIESIFSSIKSNNYNKFEYLTISPKSRATMYFNDYLRLIYNDSEKAYEYLSSETKDNYFNTYADFVNYIENYSNITLKEFSSNDDVVGVIDNYGNEYIFNISYVWKYNVSIIVNK